MRRKPSGGVKHPVKQRERLKRERRDTVKRISVRGKRGAGGAN